jgi:ketosteroid isomerase-like protein
MKHDVETRMKEEALRWLREWEALINAGDFARARSFFSADVVSFGTFAGMLIGLDDLEARQWREIWPTIADFTFEDPRILVSPGSPQMAIVIASWRSRGKDGDAGWYPRKGRATLVLKKEKDEPLRCIHSHLSMEPGIPALRG